MASQILVNFEILLSTFYAIQRSSSYFGQYFICVFWTFVQLKVIICQMSTLVWNMLI